MYEILFNKILDAIEDLRAVQTLTEEIFIENGTCYFLLIVLNHK